MLRLLRFVLCVWFCSMMQAHAQANTHAVFNFAQSVLPATSTPNHANTESAQVRLLAWAPEGIAKGKPMRLGLYIQHKPNWHTYWRNPGQAGMATTLQWKIPQALQTQDMVWATPQIITVGGLVNYGYSHDVLLVVPVQIVADIPHNTTLNIAVQADWLACKTACVPQQAQLQITLPTHKAIEQDAQLFTKLQAHVPENLPNGKAQVVLQDQQAAIQVTGLPAAWYGKKLNFYPETPQIFTSNTAEAQSWQGDTWQLKLPLDTRRQKSPKNIPVVLAMRANAALNTEQILFNTPNQTSYRIVATTQGDWKPTVSEQTVKNTVSSAHDTPTFHSTSSAPVGLGVSMLLAFVGGVVLNLMPCVFPVLAIKVLSFAHHSDSPRALRLTAYAYTAGVVTNLLLLAGTLLALRAGGAALGWGFQLQSPYIVSALALLFAVLGFNFLGWFTIPSIPLPAGFRSEHSPAVEAFLSGILTVLVATPCSAPFVGTVLAAALVLPTAHAVLLFVCMGLGLSLPVLLASVYPKLLAFLPKPGAWMELLRQTMAFFMFTTAIWLVWVLGKQSGVDAVALFLLLTLALAGVFWAWRLRAWLFRMFAIVFMIIGGWNILHLQSNPRAAAQTSGNWQVWTPQAVQYALQNNQKVFVEYSAAWCITCQLNKQTVLERNGFKQWAQDNQVTLLRADWTNQDPAITQSLHNLGRVSVPTYALYQPEKPDQPNILGEFINLEKIQQVLP